LALALASGGAQAANVVDTGSNPSGPGIAFNSDRAYAGEFSLLGDSIINSIQGYFSTTVGSVGISVLSNAGDVPGSVLFSTSLSTTVGGAAWNGVSGLNWSLAAGDYWVAFTPDYGNTLNTAPVMPGDAPYPLEAYAHTQYGTWFSSPDNVGVRIDATVAAPVPEPAGIAMYALGLAGLAVVARRRKQA
jgi:hypothetical protein